MIDQAPPYQDAERLDRVTAMGFGWTWHASSPRMGSRGIAYSSTFASDDEASAAIGSSQPPAVIKQGRRQHFWVGNCVALGDSAVTIEPLEWANLHLAHSQIDRMIAMMPGPDCAEVETRIFNDECAAEADRVRDFLCLHYICADRPEPFWRAAKSIQPPPSLEHSLSLFRERGRLPYYQEETFTRDSWLTVLLGQGVRPSRLDPLTDLVSEREAEQAFAAMQQMLHRLNVAPAPELLELNPHGIR